MSMKSILLRHWTIPFKSNHVRPLSNNHTNISHDPKSAESEEIPGRLNMIRYTNFKSNYDWQYLSTLSKEDLIYRLSRIQRKLDHFQEICDPKNVDGRDKIRVPHPDLSQHWEEATGTRRVAFKITYIGWQYLSYAWSGTSIKNLAAQHTNVVERVLLEALFRQRLLHSTNNINLDRSGRTDREVSAVSQTVSVPVRSRLDYGFGVTRKLKPGEATNGIVFGKRVYLEEGISNSDTSLDEGELPYVQLLNQALPPDIRVLAWAPVRSKFSSRYLCRSRTYRYVFMRGSLDVDLMHSAAQQLVGKHDFRNFCSKTEQNAFKHFERTIISVDVAKITASLTRSANDHFAITMKGASFLNKQVRHMVSVLFSIGMGEVGPEIIARLLDVKRTTRKPQISTAVPIPLLKTDADFSDEDVHWRWDQDALVNTASLLARQCSESAAKTDALEYMLSEIHGRIEDQGVRGDIDAELSMACMPNVTQNILAEDPNAKTVEEKREDLRKREVSRLTRKGSFTRAAQIVNDIEADQHAENS